jgi:hypothetical protein
MTTKVDLIALETTKPPGLPGALSSGRRVNVLDRRTLQLADATQAGLLTGQLLGGADSHVPAPDARALLTLAALRVVAP